MPPSLPTINSGPPTFSIVKDFSWNIENYIQCSKTFEWRVGEGPLFWYRIEWKEPLCPPGDCNPTISECSFTPTPINCDCTPVVSSEEIYEIWHMLATSVNDLCRRLNRECCNRFLSKKKVIKSVWQYDRPALCCDVEKYIASNISITDTYTAIDFCVCECVSWVDPCDCGTINQPCDDDVPYAPCGSDSISIITQGMFGIPQIKIPTRPGFNVNDIQIMKPQLDFIITKCGIFPSSLKLKHNLAQVSVLKEFILRNKLKLSEEFELVYSKDNDSWQKVIHLNGHDEKWTIVFTWSCSDDIILDVNVNKQFVSKKQNTKIRFYFNSYDVLDGKKLTKIDFNYNTKTDKIMVGQSVDVKSKTIYDEIGLFRGDWLKNPYLKVEIKGQE